MKDSLFRRLFYVTCVIVVASVIASFTIEKVTASISKGYFENSQVSSDSSSVVFVMSVNGDRVAGYIKGEKEPFIETDTAVSSLPETVQHRLREGIEFQSEKELRKAIMEYCS